MTLNALNIQYRKSLELDNLFFQIKGTSSNYVEIKRFNTNYYNTLLRSNFEVTSHSP